MSYLQNVTPLEDIPDLDDTSHHPDVNKFIRSKHYSKEPPIDNFNVYNRYDQENMYTEIEEPQINVNDHHHSHITCMVASDHIHNCRVCARLYNNEEKKVYLFIIIALGIVCILLIKRIIDRNE